jgi:tetratricopeptide (TPR) repeat protein
MDVQRYLHDEPVRACPPSAAYRVRKFARRNKRTLATAIVIAMATVTVMVALAVGNVAIRHEQARTRDERNRAERARRLADDRAAEIAQGLERMKAANTLLEQGRSSVFEQNWDEAHAAFSKALQLRPDHDAVWFDRGELNARLGLWDLAAGDFARQMELHEQTVTFPVYRHALMCLYAGDTEGYRLACRRMRGGFSGTLRGLFARDLVRSCLLGPDPDADPARLVEIAGALVADNPRDWFNLCELGVAHFRAGAHGQAVRSLRETLAVSPDLDPRMLGYPVLAMAYYRLGQAAEAGQALEEAAWAIDECTRRRYEFHDDNWAVHRAATAVWPVPWFDWVECQLYYREAKLLIDRSLPPDDPRLHVLRARALARLGWSKKAVPEYDAALALSPHDPQIRLEAYTNQASCSVALRQWDRAAVEFARASELSPEDSYLWRFRGVACFAAADLAAYQQACTAMLERFEKTEDPETAANVLLACTLRDDSLPDMARLLPLTRVADRIWHWGTWVRGAALYRTASYKESVRCFEAAAKIYRPRALDWCFLAMAQHRLGHAEEARRSLAEAKRWIEAADREELGDPTGTRPTWGGWHERVTYTLLLREAEALLSEEKRRI